MIYGDKKNAATKPLKKPLNLHASNHERFFKLRDIQRKRTGKPGMIAEDFLVDLMDLYDEVLAADADEKDAP